MAGKAMGAGDGRSRGTCARVSERVCESGVPRERVCGRHGKAGREFAPVASDKGAIVLAAIRPHHPTLHQLSHVRRCCLPVATDTSGARSLSQHTPNRTNTLPHRHLAMALFSEHLAQVLGSCNRGTHLCGVLICPRCCSPGLRSC